MNGVVIKYRCRALAKKIKEIIDVRSSFADRLNNQLVREQLKIDSRFCLVKTVLHDAQPGDVPKDDRAGVDFYVESVLAA